MNAYPVDVPDDELSPSMVSIADDVSRVFISHGLPPVVGGDWSLLVDMLETFALAPRATKPTEDEPVEAGDLL